ncbi:hypothetical protein ALP68_102748 [Pseudomonas ficuserectae]|nr:hypothetical protein ALP68_102748 [Pseudomonas ficuserectae]
MISTVFALTFITATPLLACSHKKDQDYFEYCDCEQRSLERTFEASNLSQPADTGRDPVF